jgi:hypothetical protein
MDKNTQPREQAGIGIDKLIAKLELIAQVIDGEYLPNTANALRGIAADLTQQAAPEAPKKMYGTIGHTRIPGMSPIGDVFAAAPVDAQADTTTASASGEPVMADGKTKLSDYLEDAAPETMEMDDWTKGYEECRRRLFKIVGYQLRAPAQQTERMQPSRNAAPLDDDAFEEAAREAGLNPARIGGVFADPVVAKAYKVWRAALTQQSAAQAPTEAQEDIRVARHCVFNLKEFRAGRSIFPGEALGILESALDRLAAQAAHAGADTERLDWFDQNIFHREMDDFDSCLYRNHSMWVLFAPKGTQGTARRIIDAALAATEKKEPRNG